MNSSKWHFDCQYRRFQRRYIHRRRHSYLLTQIRHNHNLIFAGTDIFASVIGNCQCKLQLLTGIHPISPRQRHRLKVISRQIKNPHIVKHDIMAIVRNRCKRNTIAHAILRNSLTYVENILNPLFGIHPFGSFDHCCGIRYVNPLAIVDRHLHFQHIIARG